MTAPTPASATRRFRKVTVRTYDDIICGGMDTGFSKESLEEVDEHELVSLTRIDFGITELACRCGHTVTGPPSANTREFEEHLDRNAL